jgi:XFP N-terminal domain
VSLAESCVGQADARTGRRNPVESARRGYEWPLTLAAAPTAYQTSCVTLELTRDELAALSDRQLAAIDTWWRACNYLTVGQIYLKDNALLERVLSAEDIQPRLLGHWGTSPGLSFI